MAEEFMGGNHGLVLQNRKQLNITGVIDVTAFDDQRVCLLTKMGEMDIRGNSLKIDNFSTEDGNLDIMGEVHAIIYTNDNSRKESFVKKLFR